MRIVIDENTKEVHLLGLDFGRVELIRSSLVDKIFKNKSDEVTAMAIPLIKLADDAIEGFLPAKLGVDDVDDL